MRRTWNVPATVLEVVDGDTVRLELDLGWHLKYVTRVRIAKINCAELVTLKGREAKTYAQTLLAPGDVVSFVSTSLDKYGRPLGHIIFGGTDYRNFGDEMVRADQAVTVDW